MIGTFSPYLLYNCIPPPLQVTLLMIFPRQIFSTKPFTSSSSPSPPPFGSPQTLLKSCIIPCVRSLNLFLSFLLRSRKFTLLLETFSQFSSNSIQIDSKTHFLITRALLKSRRFEEALQFIYPADNYNFVVKKSLWDSLIRELCVAGGDPERSLSLLHECMRNRGILPALITFRSLVLSFSSQGRMEKAIEALEIMTSEEVGYPYDNFVCSSIISGFSRIGKSELGLGFYERVQKSLTFQPNLMTYTAVVDALCRVGRIDEASVAVQKMEKDGIVLDAVLYTSWICGYFRKGLLMEAFRKHRLMSENGILPDLISYTSVIDGLCKEGHLEKVIGLLKYMEKSRLKPNLITYTCIIRGFCKRYKMEDAFFIFRKMEELNIVADEFVYSVLIDGFCVIGKLDEVFELLEEMGRKGIKATAMTYNTVVNGLCKAGKTCKADEISRNCVGDNFTYSTLLHGYMMEKDARGVSDTKKRLEQAGISYDVVTVNILIKALFISGMVDDACSLFQEMRDKYLIADSSMYCTMVDCYCKHGMSGRAVEVFMDYKSTPAFVNDACHNCMIVELCKEEKLEMATELFLELCQKNFVADTITYRKLMKAKFEDGNWEAVLKLISRVERCNSEILSSICNDSVSFLCNRQCFPAALEVYILMRLKGLTVWSKSYYILLKNLINSGNGLIIELIFCDYIKACGVFEPRIVNIICLYLCKKNVEEAIRFLPSLSKRNISLSVMTVVVNTLKEKGRVENALNFLLEAKESSVAADVVVYSIIVDGLCKAGSPEKALDICSRMRKKGISANIVTYNSVIHGLCREGCLVEAFRIFDSLECNGFFPTVVTYATLIGALAEEGFLQDAKELLGRMAVKGISPNIHIFNLLINGYCRFGLLEEGMQLFKDLTVFSLEPDDLTISSLIYGYCIKGDMQAGLDFYNMYRVKGYSPDFFGFLNLIKGLSAKGRMEEARSIIRDMLQHRESVDLINQAGDGLNFESLATDVKLACEEGRIREVINILADVGSKFCNSPWSKNCNRIKQSIEAFCTDTKKKVCTGGGLTMPAAARNILQFGEDGITEGKPVFCKNKISNSVMNEYEILCQSSLKYDFEAYYSMIATLCSKGELQKANDIVKATILNLGKEH
ncbi:pentatricopeptide repeat-containing protein At5g57250, mitochondrial [Phalaenopsis equestris]|uniref:pentatricopeptide repeat-containing protein At5g57250, mitochondrial n=1 Tax=Phalaenopsis equestris TaxID=78828 RepID=UPI0009E42B77|nr:pentatricopeptide repeat-containing protein At5g57250, mitochondrial [Phalaenopsis equestris]XP_020585017.1 pentatricopeptide repeat-containing protein At5g57250, mitochondrial [Phalaenopsis equestris]XP_020585018.1 pentatricopeptide repeat-containing protein At5g57250, mitochondrial [Phalaenopsis equestris]